MRGLEIWVGVEIGREGRTERGRGISYWSWLIFMYSLLQGRVMKPLMSIDTEGG